MSKIKHQGTQEELDDVAGHAMAYIDGLLKQQQPVVMVSWEAFFNLANSYLFLYNKSMEKGILPPPSERGNSVKVH